MSKDEIKAMLKEVLKENLEVVLYESGGEYERNISVAIYFDNEEISNSEYCLENLEPADL